MSAIAPALFSIWLLAALAWVGRRTLRVSVCPICVGVAGTWLWMLICRHFGLPVPPALEASARAGRYDAVLLMEPLPEFPERPGSGRTSNREVSLALGRELAAVWRELGHAVIPVPALPLPERAERVLALVG